MNPRSTSPSETSSSSPPLPSRAISVSAEGEDRTPLPISCYSLVVVVKEEEGEKKFLAVQETPRHGSTWYLPAGRVNKGEKFEAAAHREAKEETGIEIDIEGILRIEHSPYHIGTRLRVLFVAKPKDPNAPLKTIPDNESTGARWVTLDELKELPLRSKEVTNIFSHVATNPPIYPTTIITTEGAKYSSNYKVNLGPAVLFLALGLGLGLGFLIARKSNF